MTTIVWREYYNDAAVAQLTAMGTLPRNETEIDTADMQGYEVAAEIAQRDFDDTFESIFREGGRMVILEPVEFAGTYEIQVDYVPQFSACPD